MTHLFPVRNILMATSQADKCDSDYRSDSNEQITGTGWRLGSRFNVQTGP